MYFNLCQCVNEIFKLYQLHINNFAILYLAQMFPRKFVKKYGTNLDSRITLNAPNGLAWPVNLEILEGDVWLQDGWPEFARFYSIQFGHLLVFKYRGHCNFKVRVFDPSSTEIEYPSSTSAKLNSGKSSQVRKRPIEIDDSTSSDLIRPRKKRVRKLPSKDASHDGVCLMPKLQQDKSMYSYMSGPPQVYVFFTMKTNLPYIGFSFKIFQQN